MLVTAQLTVGGSASLGWFPGLPQVTPGETMGPGGELNEWQAAN